MKSLRPIAGITLLIGLIVGIDGVTRAEVPNTISYQGILTNAGLPPTVVPDGQYGLTFKLYALSDEATAVWTETHAGVPVTEGRFWVELGSVSPLSLLSFGTPYVLGVTVNGGTELPRIPLTSSAYSLHSRRVTTIDGATGGVISGNLTLENSSASAGNILKGGSLFMHDFGTANTFVGSRAGNLTMTGSCNTGVGDSVLMNATSGGFNTGIGFNALMKNTSGVVNTACGVGALPENTTGSGNTACGASALQSNTTGYYNTANGHLALGLNTTGNGNTASGRSALQNNTIGFDNVASGYYALMSNTAGDSNVAFGTRALYLNTTGAKNTACGAGALSGNSTGIGNTASGYGALIANTEGVENTATGRRALAGNTTGDYNTGCGRDALMNNTTGNRNTAIGYSADVSSGSLTNATAIGYNASVNASNKIRLGNTSVTVIEGQVAFTHTSDRNQKENFRSVDGDEVLGKIRGLDLSSWNYIGHDSKRFRHYGPSAQDFFAAFGHDGAGTCGDSVTINSGDMAGIMMIAIKALESRTAENAELRARIEKLERLIEGKLADWEKPAE
ncbi:MAG: tail fiber domain-containing protein [candidate division Zixibacteria bacterium]|nr:tail fiber domain-containing protein [candidate division Zixibacteria bacterium]